MRGSGDGGGTSSGESSAAAEDLGAPEFKEEAIRMALEGERTVASVAREFGINASALGSWVNRYRIASAQDEQPPSSRPRIDDAGQVRADRRGEGPPRDRSG
ncbi:transposase [Nonomuraea sp. NPDC049269]|uniref:transposase n=1 Tax=Nonomuraea sp. NPDC049269 TaxID=3364349 RepID=UPI0037123D34